MRAYPVNVRVGNVHNNDAALIEQGRVGLLKICSAAGRLTPNFSTFCIIKIELQRCQVRKPSRARCIRYKSRLQP